MGSIEAALEALKSLKLGETPNYTKIANEYGVERSTLSRRHRGVCGTREHKYENHRHLNAQQERELLKYIDGLCKRGLPPTREMIRNFAEEITGKSIGKCWADRFVKKNHIELLARWTSAIDASRHKADSAFKYSLYFELLRQKIEEYGIDSRHIYNMDEKGFLICIL